MNAPLAELVRWRVLDCAKHSAKLRHALTESIARLRAKGLAFEAKPSGSTPERAANDARPLARTCGSEPREGGSIPPRAATIGPRGVLP